MSEIIYTDPITHPITVKDGTLDIAITFEWGRNVDVVHRLLKEHRAGKSAMVSELDVRRLAIRNPEVSDLLNNYWDTPNLSASRGEVEAADSNSKVRNVLKVLLPYSTKSCELTEAVSYGLGLINPTESLVDSGVSLDKVRWNKLEGPGVHTGEIDEWFEKRADGSLIGFNEEMTRDQALRNPFLLTRLQHPDSPNHPGFPSISLDVGAVFESTTVFRFLVRD